MLGRYKKKPQQRKINVCRIHNIANAIIIGESIVKHGVEVAQHTPSVF